MSERGDLCAGEIYCDKRQRLRDEGTPGPGRCLESESWKSGVEIGGPVWRGAD
jgi:hypothetical protein